jgi:hypothetical protein
MRFERKLVPKHKPLFFFLTSADNDLRIFSKVFFFKFFQALADGEREYLHERTKILLEETPTFEKLLTSDILRCVKAGLTILEVVFQIPLEVSGRREERRRGEEERRERREERGERREERGEERGERREERGERREEDPVE